LKCCWDHKADFLRWLAGVRREDIAELFLLGSGDTRAPKSVLDVGVAKEEGALGGRPRANGVYDPTKGVAKLVH
jgi:hypothetical protein